MSVYLARKITHVLASSHVQLPSRAAIFVKKFSKQEFTRATMNDVGEARRVNGLPLARFRVAASLSQHWIQGALLTRHFLRFWSLSNCSQSRAIAASFLPSPSSPIFQSSHRNIYIQCVTHIRQSKNKSFERSAAYFKLIEWSWFARKRM